jgi:hypothetical protein
MDELEIPMSLELLCSHCACYLRAAPDTPASLILDRMIEDGPWFGLGNGETFKEMIFTALAARGRIRCPECGQAVAIGAEGVRSMSGKLSAC